MYSPRESNFQQAHNIINYDLPWNPMRLVQRHGRVDRIGSAGTITYTCGASSPTPTWTGCSDLENILHRKLMKAAKSIGAGKVLPGVEASDDVVFNARREQIQAIAGGDNALFLGTTGGLISGEEFRAMLRKAIENESLSRKLQAMPWGIGSGFTGSDRPPGYVFCARILDRADEPAFGTSPCPRHWSRGPARQRRRPVLSAEDLSTASRSLATTGPARHRRRSRRHHRRHAHSLSVASPPSDQRTAATARRMGRPRLQGVGSRAAATSDRTWNNSLDTAGADGSVAPVIREAVRHLALHGTHRNQADVDLAIKVYSRGQASRVTAIVRSVMRDDALTERNKTDRLIELDRRTGPAGRRKPRQSGSRSSQKTST